MRNVEIRPELQELASTVEREVHKGTFGIKGVKEFSVPMRDGVNLSAHVYFPDQGESWPCVLVRTPYAYHQPVLEATLTQFVKHGYVLVIQHCRGTGESGGKWEPFIHERCDGIDTLDWLIRQSFQDGNIALFGQSYSSFTTWVMADALPQEVKTVFLDLFGIDRYAQMYMNGMFRHDIYTSWAFANSGITLQEDPGILYQKALNIRPHEQADQILLGEKLDFYQNYIFETSRSSAFWQKGMWSELLKVPSKINIPVFMIEGWFDHHLDGALKGYEQLSPEIKRISRLVVGPWDHVGNSPGELSYPDANLLGTARVKAGLDWFDLHLKGAPAKFPTVEYYRIRAGTWEQHSALEYAPATRLYLNGEQGSSGRKGRLSAQPQSPAQLSYNYDPESALPTYGGSALLAWIMPSFHGAPHGSLIQPDNGDREDVLHFDTPALDEAMEITGKIQVSLKVSTDAEDTAFSVKILEVFEDGRTINIVDGITSLSYRNNADAPLDYTPNEPVTVTIEMWPIAWEIQRGSRIRVEISSSNFPAYHVHSNFKGAWASISEYKIARQTLYVGEDTSYIELPARTNP